MPRRALRELAFMLLMAAIPGLISAQSAVLDLPLQSQAAEVSQTIGITDITIKYHRPLVGEKKSIDVMVKRLQAREDINL